MAKIRQLILNKGKWDRKRIVFEHWIEESTTVKTKITSIDYGFLWWNIPFKVNENIIFSTSATANSLCKKDYISSSSSGQYHWMLYGLT